MINMKIKESGCQNLTHTHKKKRRQVRKEPEIRLKRQTIGDLKSAASLDDN